MNIVQLAERLIQIERDRQPSLGYDAGHDKGHHEQLARAAWAYESHASQPGRAPINWPWEMSYWKPKTQRLDLIRAGALHLATEDAEVYENNKKTAHQRYEGALRKLVDVLCHEPLDLLLAEMRSLVSESTGADNG